MLILYAYNFNISGKIITGVGIYLKNLKVKNQKKCFKKYNMLYEKNNIKKSKEFNVTQYIKLKKNKVLLY